MQTAFVKALACITASLFSLPLHGLSQQFQSALRLRLEFAHLISVRCASVVSHSSVFHRVRPPHLSADHLPTPMCKSCSCDQPTASSRLKDIINETQCDHRVSEPSFSQTLSVYSIAFSDACSSLSFFAFFLLCNLLPSRSLGFCLLASFTPDSHLTRLP